jgi:hypothetical protein
MRLQPTFWFSLAALMLMISGFFVQQAAKVPLIERLISPETADAKNGLDTLQQRGASHGMDLGFGGNVSGLPSLLPSDSGFRGIASLYSEFLRSKTTSVVLYPHISRIIDGCAMVPDRRGTVLLVIIELDDGEHARTSFEELREIISKDFDQSIWPWQLGLFIAGVLVSVSTIAFTHFLDKKPDLIDTKPKQDEDSTTETEDPEPTHDC